MDRVREALAARCQTDDGALAARALLRAASPQEAEERLERCSQALALADQRPLLFERLDFSEEIARARRGGVLDGAALRPLGALLRCGVAVHDAAESWQALAPTLADRATALPALRHLAFELSDAFDEEDQLVDDASPELARLRADVRRRAGGLRQRIARLMKDSDDQGLLQDDYWTVRDGRYVLPMRASDKRALGGIIHGSSQTGQTFYVEPQELVDANNALALASEAVKREEHRILTAFSHAVGLAHEELADLRAGLTGLDCDFAAAALAAALDASRPELEGGLELRRARHPLLVLDGVAVVPNAIALPAPARWLVVSGPNGGGKTVALTTAGLAVEMAAHGLFICGDEGSRVPWVRQTVVVLGDAQDLDRGLSTFSGHLERLQAALDAAPTGGAVPTLVLLDELASGTEPSAGAALARALLEAFADRPTIGLASTHFEAVKLLAVADERFANAALTLGRDSLAPTFRLEVGAVGSSSPLALAARIGLDPGVVDRASALIGGGGQEAERLLGTLQEMRRSLEQRLREAERERAHVQNARRQLDEQRRAERKRADQRIAALAAEAVAELQTALDEARAARKRVADPNADAGDVARLSRRLAAQHKAARRALERARGPQAPRAREVAMDPTTLSPGDRLWHRGLGRDVEVVEVDLKRGRVHVVAGGLEVKARVDELSPAQETRRRPKNKPRETPAPPPADDMPYDDHDTRALRERTCDLRGMRVDEAIAEVDQHLDQAIVSGARGICVVHGMGTGALRKAVTRHLASHPQVARSRLGRAGEGGAGATLVWMRVE